MARVASVMAAILMVKVALLLVARKVVFVFCILGLSLKCVFSMLEVVGLLGCFLFCVRAR